MTPLRILGALFIVGGVVRLLANRSMFAIFRMENLWLDEPYFIYIYKVLGGFVVTTGLLLFVVSSVRAVRAVKYGMVLTGSVMFVTGWWSGLPPVYYLIDGVFCCMVALVMHKVQGRLSAQQGHD